MHHYKTADLSGGLPASIQTEITVLGAMLSDIDAVAEAIAHLDPEDFALDSHQRIYRTMLAMKAEGLAIDLITVDATLTKRGEFDAIGGSVYLGHLIYGIPRNLNIESYVRIIKEKASLRHTLSIFNDGMAEIAEGGADSKDLISRAKVALSTIEESTRDTCMEHFGTYMVDRYKHDPEEVFTHSAKLVGVATGLDSFDRITSTLQPTDLWIIAGRAKMGKTALATSIIKNIVLAPFKPKTVGAFFLEQSKNSIQGRLLCAAAEASFQRYRDGELYEAEKLRIRQAIRDYAKAPLHMRNGKPMTTTDLFARARRMKREFGLDLLVIDQISHLLSDDFYRKGMQRDEIAGEKVKRVKNILQELNVPGLVLAQLNRASTKNPGAVPQLADIAESGQIEQHADGVAFVHRPEYYDRLNQELHNRGQIIVAAQRDGPTGTLDIEYIKDSCLWLDKASVPPPESGSRNFRDDSY